MQSAVWDELDPRVDREGRSDGPSISVELDSVIAHRSCGHDERAAGIAERIGLDAGEFDVVEIDANVGIVREAMNLERNRCPDCTVRAIETPGRCFRWRAGVGDRKHQSGRTRDRGLVLGEEKIDLPVTLLPVIQ